AGDPAGARTAPLQRRGEGRAGRAQERPLRGTDRHADPGQPAARRPRRGGIGAPRGAEDRAGLGQPQCAAAAGPAGHRRAVRLHRRREPHRALQARSGDLPRRRRRARPGADGLPRRGRRRGRHCQHSRRGDGGGGNRPGGGPGRGRRAVVEHRRVRHRPNNNDKRPIGSASRRCRITMQPELMGSQNMSTRIFTSLTLSAAIAAALASGTALAQDNGQTASGTPATPNAGKNTKNGKSVQALEQVVVTGSANTAGVRKIDASYSITTATAALIQQDNPRSAADLLKIAPGVWPESTGGQTGANIEIAGFPGGGDAPFYTNQIMGTPLYGMPSLSFFEQSSMFRLDDTVDHVELLLGGPSVVFGDGQIGLTSNYILKQGTDTPSGSIGVTYGTENLKRVDGFYGFPIGKGGWYGSVGGFYRESNGVRDPQFPADKGGQLTATPTKDWDNGSLVFWARGLDDKNQFITPIPLIQTGSGQFTAYPGFDPQTDTYYSKAMQHVYLESYPGGGTSANLADGRGAQLGFFGANFDWDFGNG